jgi:hypothetical protein
MTKHLWCWGDIINPDLADKALCAEQARERSRADLLRSERDRDPVSA